MENVTKKTIVVEVDDNHRIKHDVYVDQETGLDVDIDSGDFRTREETEEFVREVYRIGKEAMPHELERYNKWIQTGGNRAKEEKLFKKPSWLTGNVAEPVVTPSMMKATQELSEEDRHEFAVVRKNEGNEALGKGDLRTALRKYSEGIAFDGTIAALYSNRAEVNIRLQRWRATLQDSSKAVELQPSPWFERAAFRRAIALTKLGLRAEALQACQDGLTQSKKSAAVADSVKRWEMQFAEVQKTSTAVCFVATSQQGNSDVEVLPKCLVEGVKKGEVICELPLFLNVPRFNKKGMQEVDNKTEFLRQCVREALGTKKNYADVDAALPQYLCVMPYLDDQDVKKVLLQNYFSLIVGAESSSLPSSSSSAPPLAVSACFAACPLGSEKMNESWNADMTQHFEVVTAIASRIGGHAAWKKEQIQELAAELMTVVAICSASRPLSNCAGHHAILAEIPVQLSSSLGSNGDASEGDLTFVLGLRSLWNSHKLGLSGEEAAKKVSLHKSPSSESLILKAEEDIGRGNYLTVDRESSTIQFDECHFQQALQTRDSLAPLSVYGIKK